jgi:hypothetical protein
MNINQITEFVGTCPTIMSLKDELAIIAQLLQLSPDEVMSNYDKFTSVLDRVHESHTGGAVFEVNRDNMFDLEVFAKWLRELASRVESDSQRAYLISTASDLTAPFSSTE